jgi:serine/threonine protein kinase
MSVTSPHRSHSPRAPATTEWPGTGIVLVDRYELVEFVAAGAAAAVWRAHDHQLDRDVAIKLLLPHRAADEVAVSRFRVEALATVRATHPNAVEVFDACTDGSLTFLVMEFVDGPSLAACGLPIPSELGAAVGAQIASALGAAHDRGLVHRDVKPGNVLVDATGWVKVVDFGIARVLDEPTGLTLPHMGMGTARYAAPELLTGGEIGPWTDLYGLGLTLWEALVARPAFEADTIHQLALTRLEQEVADLRDHVDVPAELADVVRACTQRDPRDRPRDGGTVAATLQGICGPRPYEATRRLVGT